MSKNSQRRKNIWSHVLQNPISHQEVSIFKVDDKHYDWDGYKTILENSITGFEDDNQNFILFDDNRYTLLNNGFILKIIEQKKQLCKIELMSFDWDDLEQLPQTLYHKTVELNYKTLSNVLDHLRMADLEQLSLFKDFIKQQAPLWPLSVAGTVLEKLKPMLEINYSLCKAPSNSSFSFYADNVQNFYTNELCRLRIWQLNYQELLYVRNTNGINYFETDSNFPYVVPSSLVDIQTKNLEAIEPSKGLRLNAFIDSLDYQYSINPTQRPIFLELGTLAKFEHDKFPIYLSQRLRNLTSAPHFVVGPWHVKLLAYLGLYRPQDSYDFDFAQRVIGAFENISNKEYSLILDDLQNLLELLWNNYLVAVYAANDYTRQHALDMDKAIKAFINFIDLTVIEKRLNVFISFANAPGMSDKAGYVDLLFWDKNRKFIQGFIDAWSQLGKDELPFAYRLFFSNDFACILYILDTLAYHSPYRQLPQIS